MALFRFAFCKSETAMPGTPFEANRECAGRCRKYVRKGFPKEDRIVTGKNLAGVAVGLVLATLFQPAYAGPKFADYPARKASECQVTGQRGGLVVGLQPMEDPKDQKLYFDVEFAPKGYMPVYIVLENGSAKDSFLFDKTSVGYAAVSNPGSPDAHSVAGDKMASVGMGGLIAMNLITRATEVQQNILKKEVQSSTLSPGASTLGFLYVPVPKKGPRDKIHMQIPISKAGSSETHVLNLYF
jgi:hypothetical protein